MKRVVIIAFVALATSLAVYAGARETKEKAAVACCDQTSCCPDGTSNDACCDKGCE